MREYTTIPEYEAYRISDINVRKYEALLDEAEKIKTGCAEALATAMCTKFLIGQKVRWAKSGVYGIVVGLSHKSAWAGDMEVAPHYVLKKAKKDGTTSDINVYHGWPIPESELEAVE